MNNNMRPIHPGEVLLLEFADRLHAELSKLSRYVEVDSHQLLCILSGAAPVTAEVAEKLANWYETTPDFWLNLQAAYDKRTAPKGEDATYRE